MQEYTYTDFLNTLDDTGRYVVEAVRDHIAGCHPEYKPFDIRPNNKTLGEWTLNFRKKPKVGKALCSLYSSDGRLSMRVVFLGFMKNEALLRQDEFGDAVRRYITSDLCERCRAVCDYEYRQYYCAKGQLIASSRPGCAKQGYSTEYAEIDNISRDDINDILHLIDLQSKHMTQDPRDIRGSGYLEASRERCGDVEIITLEETELDIDDFEKSDYVNADTKKLDRYASVYYLTPMGEHEGLWYFHDGNAICGKTAYGYNHTVIPEGPYASVTINDPFSFSARRVWDYIAKWMWDSNKNIRPVDLSGESVPYFVRFYRDCSDEYMTMYVPL